MATIRNHKKWSFTKAWVPTLFLVLCFCGAAHADAGISGQVTNTAGQPLNNVTVQVHGESSGSTFFTYGFTNGEGRYSFLSLLPGTYKVLADTYGSQHEQYMPTWYDDDQFYSTGALVTVTSGQVTENINFALVLYGSISGRITNSQGNPIQNIMVSAYNTIGNQYGILNRLTNANGEYILYLRQGGRYRIYADTEGTPYKAEYYNNVESQASATLLDMNEGQTLPNIDFSLALHTGGSISGRVLDPDGNPLAGQYVNAQSIVYCDGCNGYDETDAGGYYKIEKLNAADYRVQVSVYGYPTQYYYLQPGDLGANPVPVLLGQDTADIDFKLSRGGKISGRVLDNEGNPVANAPISVNSPQRSWGSGYTDAEGNYETSALAPGQYRASAESRKAYYDSYSHVDHDGSPLMNQVYQNKLTWEEGDLIEVTDGQTTANINFDFMLGGGISGSVTVPGGISLAGRRVNAWPVNGNGNYYDYCDNSGNFIIQGMPAGQYVIAADKGYSSQERNLVEMYYNNKPSRESADPVTVTLGSTVPNVNLQLVAGGSISGTVMNSGFVGVEDVDVYVLSVDGKYIAEESTDQNGYYLVAALPAGTYKLVALPQGLNYGLEFYNSQSNFGSANSVTVTAGGGASGINFWLDPGGKISGRVVRDEDGQPVAGIQVTADDSNNEFLEDLGYASTDANGYYEIRGLRTGSYKINVRDNYDEYDFNSEYYSNQSTWASATPISVSAGNTTADINISIGLGAPPQATVIKTPVYKTSEQVPSFTWSSVPGAASYELKMDDITSGATDVIRVTGLTGTTYTATSSLVVGHEYWIQVRAVNAQGSGPWSTVTRFTQLQPLMYQLHVVVNPTVGGTVSLDPSGGGYYPGTTVTVGAVPASGGWKFAGWSGDFLSSDPPTRTIAMDSNKSITANFILPGDVDGNHAVNIADVIMVLRIMAGMEMGTSFNLGADVDGDGKIGFAEVFYAIQATIESQAP